MAKALLCRASLLPFPREGQVSCEWLQSTQTTLRPTIEASWDKSLRLKTFQVRSDKRELRDGCAFTIHEGRSLLASLFTDFKGAGNRHRKVHRRNNNGAISDPQSSIIDTETTAASTTEVEIVEDNEVVEVTSLEDRFERFTRAMASDDKEMAEQVVRELGNVLDVSEMKSLMEGVTELEENLQELYLEVYRIIEKGDKEAAREIVEANYEALLDQLAVDTKSIEHAAMLDILAQLRLSLGDFDEVERLLIQVKNILDNLGPGAPQPLVDNIMSHMASMYTALGKSAEAQPIFENSLHIQEDVLGNDNPLLLKLLLDLAATYTENNETDKAIEAYQRAVGLIGKTTSPNDEMLAQPLAQLGHLLLQEERFDEAEAALLRVVRIVESTLGINHRQAGGATCALARAKATKGDFDEAVFLYRKGLQTLEQSNDYFEDDITMESVCTDLAELLDALDRGGEAQELWEPLLQEKEKRLGTDNPLLAPILQGLAISYANAEKYGRAEPLLRRTFKLLTAESGPDSPEASVPLEHLASVLHHLGKDYEAEPLARRVLHIREAAFGPFGLPTGEACNGLASILHSMNKCEEAFTLMQRVLEIQEKELGHNSPEIGLTLQLQVMLLDSLNRKSEITPILNRMERLSRHLEAELQND